MVGPQNRHPSIPPSSSSAPSFSLIQRRSTTELEANPVTTSDNDSVPGDTDSTGSHRDPYRERAAALRPLLRSALGSNTLTAHSESRIASVTFFSVFVIYIKIFSISGAAWFKTAVWFSLSGWVAVQALLILHARRRKLSEKDAFEVLRLIQMVDEELNFNTKKPDRRPGRSWRWSNMFFILHLPFWTYISYQVIFGWKEMGLFTRYIQHEENSFTDWAINWAVGTYVIIKFGLGFFTAIFLILGCISWAIILIRDLFRVDLTMVLPSLRRLFLYTVVTLLFVAVWIFGALNITVDDVKGWWSKRDDAGGVVTDGPRTGSDNPHRGEIALKIAWYVGYGGWNTAWVVVGSLGIGSWCFDVAGLVVDSPQERRTKWLRTTGLDVNEVVKVRPHDRRRVAIFNVLFTLGIFLWYVYTYESEGTSKWWLGEYLG